MLKKDWIGPTLLEIPNSVITALNRTRIPPAKTIKRVKSSCRRFSKRMHPMSIMHSPYAP
jgi:hypothetical protein